MTEAEEVVARKVRQAVAANALHRIAGIVAEEERVDAAKRRYSRWMLRYGIALMLVLAIVLARYMGVF